jgi:RimJ/RimL family protein N-acetyltransferase
MGLLGGVARAGAGMDVTKSFPLGHIGGVDLAMNLDLGGSRLRTLTAEDASLVVEATSGETGRALWGARPVGPYSLSDAQAALELWDWRTEGQTSYGVIEGGRLVAALGVMSDDRGSAELAYWVRPENRRRGVALLALRALSEWVHRNADVSCLWLEINPENVASQRLAHRAGYRLAERLHDHCRSWVSDDPARDVWHDCLIWTYEYGS